MSAKPESSVALRPARPGDATGITLCVKAAYKLYLGRMDKEPGPMLADYAEMIRRHEVHIAIDSAESLPDILGVLVLIAKPDRFLLDNVAVDPRAQGLGVGRKLISLAENRALESGYKRIELYTHELMTENQQMYPKLGYSECRRVTEHGYQRIYFEKLLG